MEVVGLVDETWGGIGEVMLLREVHGRGVVRVNARVQRGGGGKVVVDDAVDESQWARGGGGLLRGSQSGFISNEGFDTKSSPHSSSFSSSSSTVPPVGQRRYRHFLSHGSFDTQISSPQLSPRGERRGPVVFNDVHEFGSELGTQLPVLDEMCGVGLQLKQLSQADEIQRIR